MTDTTRRSRTYGAPPTLKDIRAEGIRVPERIPTLREREAFWRVTAFCAILSLLLTLSALGVEVAKLRAENGILRASAGMAARR